MSEGETFRLRVSRVRMKTGGADVRVLHSAPAGDAVETLVQAIERARQSEAHSVGVIIAHSAGISTLYHAGSDGGEVDLMAGCADLHHRLITRRWGHGPDV